MELEKPKKPEKPEVINYGDLFSVEGELASKPVTPQDAAAMESAEKDVLGSIPAAAISSVMKSVADLNERRGLVGHDDTTDAVKDAGPSITETTIAGHRVVAESIAGQDNGKSKGSPN